MKTILSLAILLLSLPAYAETTSYSASGMVMSNTCYPVERCSTIAVSSLNTSTVRGTADFIPLAAARTRRIDELTVIAAARIAAVQESSTQIFPGGGQYSTSRIASYTTQTNDTLTAATTYINNTLTTTSTVLDYVPQWPRF